MWIAALVSEEHWDTLVNSVFCHLPYVILTNFYRLWSSSCLCVPGMPVCLLCTCLGGSVYCDDLKLDGVPPLPKDTTHFYARYNKITKINKSDFANMSAFPVGMKMPRKHRYTHQHLGFLPGKLKRIDLTANEIASIDDRAFMGLPELEELIVRENHIRQLPALPETMTLIDASHNNIDSKGIHKEAFKVRTFLQRPRNFFWTGCWLHNCQKEAWKLNKRVLESVFSLFRYRTWLGCCTCT